MTFLQQLTRFRVQRFWLDGSFAVYLTHWFYFSNHAYTGEHRYYVRIGRWRKNFGPVV